MERETLTREEAEAVVELLRMYGKNKSADTLERLFNEREKTNVGH